MSTPPSTDASGAAAAASAQAAVANAVKACGTVVRLEDHEFARLLSRMNEPLVVTATGGFFSTNYQYLTSYKGLAFFCKASKPLDLPADTELVKAKKISIPDI